MDAIVYDKVGQESARILKYLLGTYPQETITDQAVASFDDGADDVPVKSLTVNIEPVQDLHGYENPWPAGGGKNKCASYRVGQDKTIYTAILFADIDNFAPDTTYTISFVGKNGNRIYFNESIFTTRTVLTLNGTRQSVTLTTLSTLPSKDTYGWIIAKNDIAQPEPNVFDNLMIETGSTAHNYEPYSNICPISGWTGANVSRTGKNLLLMTVDRIKALSPSTPWTGNKTTKNNVEFEIITNSDNNVIGIRITGQASATTTLTLAETDFGQSNFNSFGQVSSDYIASSGLSGDSSATYGIQYQANITATYIRIANGYNPSGIIIKPMIRLASESDATFAPYIGTTIPISWQSEAGTVYGGTLDVTSGVLTVDRAYATISSFDGVWGTASAGWCRFSSQTLSGAYFVEGVLSGSISNCAEELTAAQLARDVASGNISVPKFAIASSSVFVIALPVTTLQDANTYLTNNIGTIELCYKLANPTTYQLTPTEINTLLGTNNIWADCGNVAEITYRADLGKYIDKAVAVAAANTLNA